MPNKLSAFERLVCARASQARTPGSCWSWTGSRDAKGYGFISVNGRTRRVHIVAWELATGRKLRRGYTLQHTCRNPSCWRPSHVTPWSRSRNTADGNRANPRSTEKARAAKAARRAAEWRKRNVPNETWREPAPTEFGTPDRIVPPPGMMAIADIAKQCACGQAHCRQCGEP